MKYERRPGRIYELSFETVARESNLDGLPRDVAPVVARIIHAGGMPDVVDDLAFSKAFVACGLAALRGGASILCDTRMTACGIMERFLPASSVVKAMVDDCRTGPAAAKTGITRAAAGVELCAGMLSGSIVVIGSAPTALFRLLELMDTTGSRPALIVGFPVGFVGAAESKAELESNPRGAEYITLRGRRGGSGMAAAAVNALTIMCSQSDGSIRRGYGGV